MTAREFHLVDPAVLVHLDLKPFGKRVDDARADAVQTAGDLVAPAAELAAGVQDGENDLKRRPSGLRLNIDGNAAPVIHNGDGVALVDRHADLRAVAGKRLVDGVVHDLIDQVVQAAGAGRADIHARTLAHGFQTLENLNLRGVVFFRYGGDHVLFFLHWCSPVPKAFRK